MISIIIPFYNEENQINPTLNGVREVMDNLSEGYELILIDDGSSDNTWNVMKSAALADQKIRAFSFSKNFGKEAALCAGLDYASGDAVITMDGDLQHPPAYIPAMIQAWHDGYEVVEGIKANRGTEKKHTRFLAKHFYRIFKFSSGIDLNNASDFKLLDRKVINAWKQLDEKNTFFRALSAWLGFRRKSFTFEVADRKNGQSKWSILKLSKLGSNAITGFSSFPLKLIFWLGFLMILICGFFSVQTLINWFLGNAASGFTTVILLQLFIGGSVMISLGLIGLYISKIFEEVKNRPRYLISDMTKVLDNTIKESREK